MKTVETLARLVAENEAVQDAQIIRVHPEVRTGMSFPLPPWAALPPKKSPSKE